MAMVVGVMVMVLAVVAEVRLVVVVYKCMCKYSSVCLSVCRYVGR